MTSCISLLVSIDSQGGSEVCGIFGLVLQNKTIDNYRDIKNSVELLFLLSQVRGQDSAGIALLTPDEIQIFRRVIKPPAMLKNAMFEKTLNSAYLKYRQLADKSQPLIIIGQCRLATNGSKAIDENNQPVYAGHFVGVHNGIISIDAKLLEEQQGYGIRNSVIKESLLAKNDTKFFFSLIDNIYRETGHFIKSVSKAFSKVEGSASVALLCDSENKLVIASNTGSLYYLIDPRSSNAVFTSEKKILTDFLMKSPIFSASLHSGVAQVKAGSGIEFEKASATKFSFKEEANFKDNKPMAKSAIFTIRDIKSGISSLKRCTKCILPHTYPFISFDEKGVCNFCNQYQRQKVYGIKELGKIFDNYRSKDGKPDCLVGISGGRDSSYGLHIIKTEFGMHPIAYTYDWGLTTDIARVNQAKICGKLGVEHIIRTPNLGKKRRCIRKNIYAWLKVPKLGMVPLFMAGDKDFYHFGRQLRKELNLKLTIFCSGQLFEQREFFIGFCGVDQKIITTARLYSYSNMIKLKLAFWYLYQYLRNPRYINESFFDSIRSYFTSFIQKDDFLYLYEYLPWDEKKIESTLKKEYGWESYDAYGPNQWRMGDGQTAFTNYIFYTLAGFTEFDNFRAKQIRDGLLTRDEALALVEIDNRPKYAALEYFSYLVGFNLDEVLAKISSLPKLF